jgi:PhnB protein
MSEHKRNHEDTKHESGADSKKAKTCEEKFFKVEPYLYFNGNCAEAIDFYTQMFNGEKGMVMAYKDAPMPVPENYKDKVMHASMSFHEGAGKFKNTLMFSDIMPEKHGEFIVGNNVHLSVAGSDFEHMKGIWNRFTVNHSTKITLPLEKQFWGSIFGSLTDPFGNNWMFSLPDKDAPPPKDCPEPLPTEYFMVEPYFYFDGNCSSAIDYYVNMFKGNKTFSTCYKDCPMPVSEEHKDKIMHACMTFYENGGAKGCFKNQIMFSDLPQEQKGTCKVGNNLHLSLGASCYDHLKPIWDRFVADKNTKVTMPFEKQFWGDIFGSVTDAQGVHWMFCAHDESAGDKQKTTCSFPETYFKIEPYLYFDGNCAEAIDFYAQAFQSDEKPFVKTYGEGPMGKKVAEADQHKIMHGSFSFSDPANRCAGKNTIMFSDVIAGFCGGAENKVGNNVQLSISMTNYEHMKGIWERFTANPKTKVVMPLQKQFWGSIYGTIIDPYGVNWMFSTPDKAEGGDPAVKKDEGK